LKKYILFLSIFILMANGCGYKKEQIEKKPVVSIKQALCSAINSLPPERVLENYVVTVRGDEEKDFWIVHFEEKKDLRTGRKITDDCCSIAIDKKTGETRFNSAFKKAK
jgi:hypothetical protein